MAAESYNDSPDHGRHADRAQPPPGRWTQTHYGDYPNVDRLTRTVNLWINVGKWSTQGALNVMKVRLADYYHGFDA